MRVLGVDPGLTRCGVGVVESGVGNRLRLVDVGVVRTSPELEHAYRLLQIEQGLRQWIDAFTPDVIAVERVFAQHNLESVLGTAQAAGITMLVAAQRDIPVHLHTPSEVKAAVTGNGRANKEQVGLMVARILNIAEAPKPADAADALALAICHLWRGGSVNRYAAAVAGATDRSRM